MDRGWRHEALSDTRPLLCSGFFYGAGGQTRTGTRFPSPDFKSGMSTNSITPACDPWSVKGPNYTAFD